MENYEDIDIKRILEIIFSKKIFIILILLLSITLGYVYSYYYKQPEYKSSVTILLVADENKVNKEVTQTDLNINSSLISTYSSIAKSTNVVQKTINNLGLDMSAAKLQKNIEATQIEKTQFLKITVKNGNPETAKNIANELAKVFTEQIKEIYNLENISIVDEAEIENTPFNINHVKDMVIFACAGIFVSAILVMVIYLLDDTIKDEKQIERNIKLQSLGRLPIDKDKNELIIENNPKSHIVESIKTIRTNILYTNNKKTILITSSRPNEGKSWIINNLAVAFAQAGKNVILVDTDLRKENNRNEIFNVEKGEGLSDFIKEISDDKLENLAQSKKYIKETKIPNLHMLQNGTIPPNPAELISSENMKSLLDLLKSMYDVVLLDGTPCMVVSDSIALSSMVDSTILIAESKKTKTNDLKKTKKLIEDVNGKILGVITNKAELQSGKYYGKKYGYYYGSEAKELGKLEEKQKTFSLEEVIKIAEENIKEELLNKEEIIEEDNNIPEESIEINHEISNVKNEILNEIKKLKNIFIQLKTDTTKKQIYAINNEINNLKEAQVNNNKELLEKIESIKEIQNNSNKQLVEKIENINYEEKFEQINNELKNNKEEYAKIVEEINNKFMDSKEEYAKTVENINNKFMDSKEQYSKTMEDINERLISDKEEYKKTVEEINNKLMNNKEEYAKTVEDINNRLISDKEEYTKTVEEINNQLMNNKEEYTKTVEEINNQLINNKEEYTKTVEEINEKLTNNKEEYTKTVEEINNKLMNNKEEYAKTVEDINNKLINDKEEYVQIIEDIKVKDDENLKTVIQQFISEINNLKSEIKELKETQANNNSEILEKIEKVNFEEKLAEINEKIENINYDEKLTEINNKIKENETKNANNIISFEALKEKRKANKKVFKTNESISYEDLERLSTYIIDLNGELTSDEAMSN